MAAVTVVSSIDVDGNTVNNFSIEDDCGILSDA